MNIQKLLQRIEKNTSELTRVAHMLDVRRQRFSTTSTVRAASSGLGSMRQSAMARPARDARGRFVSAKAAMPAVTTKGGGEVLPRTTGRPVDTASPIRQVVDQIVEPSESRPRDARGRFVSSAAQVTEARERQRETKGDRRLGGMIVGAIKSGFGAAGETVGANDNSASDIAGTATAGPMWSAAREVIEVAGDAKENRLASAIIKKLGQKRDATVTTGTTGGNGRDNKGRFVKVADSGLTKDHLEFAEQNLAGVNQVKKAVDEMDDNADRRNHRLVSAIVDNGGGSGIADSILSGLGLGSVLKKGKMALGTVAKSGKGVLSSVFKSGGSLVKSTSSGIVNLAKSGGSTLARGAGGILARGAGMLGLGGGGSTVAASSSGLAASLGPVLGVLGSGAAGYGVGTLINKGIGKMTGGGEGWLGNWLYDQFHPRDEPSQKKAPVRYAMPREIPQAKRQPVREIKAPRYEAGSAIPKVIVETVPVPQASTQPSAAKATSSKRDRSSRNGRGGDYIPTLFDDTVLTLLAMDRI